MVNSKLGIPRQIIWGKYPPFLFPSCIPSNINYASVPITASGDLEELSQRPGHRTLHLASFSNSNYNYTEIDKVRSKKGIRKFVKFFPSVRDQLQGHTTAQPGEQGQFETSLLDQVMRFSDNPFISSGIRNFTKAATLNSITTVEKSLREKLYIFSSSSLLVNRGRQQLQPRILKMLSGGAWFSYSFGVNDPPPPTQNPVS